MMKHFIWEEWRQVSHSQVEPNEMNANDREPMT